MIDDEVFAGHGFKLINTRERERESFMQECNLFLSSESVRNNLHCLYKYYRSSNVYIVKRVKMFQLLTRVFLHV